MQQQAIKLRIYPDRNQVIELAQHFGACRFIYNYFLNQRKEAYLNSGSLVTTKQLFANLTQLKQDVNYSWLNDINSQSLQSALWDLDVAYGRFFKKISRFPKFKSKYGKQTFGVPQHFKLLDNTLKIPKLKQPLKFKYDKKFDWNRVTKINSVTISKNKAGQYFASVQFEGEVREKQLTSHNEIGIDLGLIDYLADSNGNKIANPKWLRRKLKQIKHQHRQHSKKKKASKNRNKARIKLACTYNKVTNQRNNFIHQTTSKLISENQVICLESLAVKNMIQNHCLALSIQDASWGQFVDTLTYKAKWYGREVVRIDRWFPSSKTCSNCGVVVESLPLKIRNWTCEDCGEHHDRDTNAALNILKQGLNILSGSGIESDVKQKLGEASVIQESMNQESLKALT